VAHALLDHIVTKINWEEENKDEPCGKCEKEIDAIR
jgi:hypothetical protein